jgi:hypothetical protein
MGQEYDNQEQNILKQKEHGMVPKHANRSVMDNDLRIPGVPGSDLRIGTVHAELFHWFSHPFK